MKILKIIPVFLFLILLSSGCLKAGLQIHGQREDEVNIKYLYLNKISLNENREKIIIYSMTMPDNFINIRGRASAKSGHIEKVKVSTDGKKTWQEADLTDNGKFSYRFSADSGVTYKIFVEVTDTGGKTNNVDLTGREVTFSDDNIREAITSVLDAMVEAYKNKNTMDFMTYISSDFAGDADILEMAIHRDFSFFNNMELRYVLNTVSADSNGNIFVTLSFNRFLISTRNGESFTDNGTTAFVFHPGHDYPVVFSMKSPLIFGISNTEELATGTVIASGNNSSIVVDERGNLSVETYGTTGTD